MLTTIRQTLARLDLLGPIFSKELRTAARQRRIYILRFLYVALLTVVVGLVWYATVPTLSFRSFDPAYARAQMSAAGLRLLCWITGFQFLALQLLSPVLTSTAVSDEISHDTLGVLMMTPITSLQIVVGKLASKLLTLVLLVAAGLPLLAIVRIFGGIEWQTVLGLVCMTLCAALFAAAISLTFSIFHRKAYASIIMTYISLLTLYAFLPSIICYFVDRSFFMTDGTRYYRYFNPFYSFWLTFYGSRAGGGAVTMGWLNPFTQSVLLLVATIILVVFSAAVVRWVALHMASGEDLVPFKKKELDSADDDPRPVPDKTRSVRPVSDRPVLWREMHLPMMGTRSRQIILVSFIFLALVWTYTHTWVGINRIETHELYTTTFLLITLIVTALLAAMTITTEKESSTWEVLMATPLSPREIVAGKVLGVIKRTWPVAALYGLHITVFTLLGKIHPLAFLGMAILMAGPFLFLVGTGTFLSTRVRYTTTAVLLNLGLALAIWVVLPCLAFLFDNTNGRDRGCFALSMLINPVPLNTACLATLTTTPDRSALFFVPGFNQRISHFLPLLTVISAGYALFGAFFYEWAILTIRSRSRS